MSKGILIKLKKNMDDLKNIKILDCKIGNQGQILILTNFYIVLGFGNNSKNQLSNENDNLG